MQEHEIVQSGKIFNKSGKTKRNGYGIEAMVMALKQTYLLFSWTLENRCWAETKTNFIYSTLKRDMMLKKKA